MRCATALAFLILLAACSGSGGTPVAAPTALAIFPTSLSGGAPGELYLVTLIASGGTGSGYTWSLVSGAPPPGIGGLPATGRHATLSGTLGPAGRYEFTVELRDSAGERVTVDYTIDVTTEGPPPPPPPGPGPGPGTGPISLVNAPSARGYHTAVWSGSEMIVWGGLDMLGMKNTGGAYDPAADTWRTLPTAGAPAGRYLHTAVWTGTEMIVWGGSDSQGAVNTGGAYDPSSNAWRSISTANAPERRILHSAVWTGSRMIVWGGQGVFAPPAPNSVDKVLSDGFAYDPGSDSWTQISANAPPASRGHTAVWTGTRMIVWGGRDAFALTIVTQNTGGVYDPVADQWMATGTATAPSARMDHTAVWTASGMIVWGGTTGVAAPVQTGAIYAPASDSWSTTTTTGAPSARTDHTAVWTGSTMIVWGGRGASGFFGDGATYSSAGNIWSPLSTAFTPTARAHHTAVWTGTSMIIWGGATSPADTYLNSGAILTP